MDLDNSVIRDVVTSSGNKEMDILLVTETTENDIGSPREYRLCLYIVSGSNSWLLKRVDLPSNSHYELDHAERLLAMVAIHKLAECVQDCLKNQTGNEPTFNRQCGNCLRSWRHYYEADLFFLPKLHASAGI